MLRGYLANAERVRVRGAEFDGSARITAASVVLRGDSRTSDGTYVSFPDAPPPLEDTGGPQVKDISGSVLPGISAGRVARRRVRAPGRACSVAPASSSAAVDASYRSSFSSSATASRYLIVDGYGLLNPRVGFRWADGWSVSRVVAQPAGRELLRAALGGARRLGLYVGLPGDPRTVGVTLRMAIRSRP